MRAAASIYPISLAWSVRCPPASPALPPQVRCAGAVWLVSLLLHCGRHPRLVPLLPDAQEALSQLLGDQSELTQVRSPLPPRQVAYQLCTMMQECH